MFLLVTQPESTKLHANTGLSSWEKQKSLQRELRPNRSVKFTKCPVSIVINENDDGSWEVSKATLEHFGHSVTKKDYYLHEHTKRLNEDDKEYVKGLLNDKANAANMY